MIERLTGVRDSKLGTVLFYGYFIAFIITTYVLGFALLRLHQQDLALKSNSARQCLALRGAADFWRQQRMAINLELQDFALTPIARNADEGLSVALDHIIDEADALSCGGR